MTKRCKCGLNFTFSKKDKEYYDQKGYPEPKRCPKCRAERKAIRGNTNSSPNNKSYYDRGMFDSSIMNVESIKDFTTLTSLYGAKFANLEQDDFMFGGIIRFNTVHNEQNSFSEFRLFYKEFIDRIRNRNEMFEINNTGFKNFNGVYLNVLHPYGELIQSKIYIAKILEGIYKQYTTIDKHFNGEFQEYLNDEIWIDAENFRIYVFGEDNMRRIYAHIMEDNMTTLSAKMRMAYTSEIYDINDHIASNKPLHILGKDYPEDARTLIVDLLDREKNFRGLNVI